MPMLRILLKRGLLKCNATNNHIIGSRPAFINFHTYVQKETNPQKSLTFFSAKNYEFKCSNDSVD